MNEYQHNLILIPLGHRFLALSPEDFAKALKLGQDVAGVSFAEMTPAPDDLRLLDADAASKMTGIPSSWFLEQARRGKIPYIKAGKYVRFRMPDLIEALEIRPGHKAISAYDGLKAKQKR